MARVAIALTVVDRTERLGIVQVFDAAGNVTRSYRITAAQLAAVQAGGVPPLLLRATWESGRAAVGGLPCLRGQIFVNPDGSAVVNRGSRVVGNVLDLLLGRLAPEEFGVRADAVVEVETSALDRATVDPAYSD